MKVGQAHAKSHAGGNNKLGINFAWSYVGSDHTQYVRMTRVQ